MGNPSKAKAPFSDDSEQSLASSSKVDSLHESDPPPPYPAIKDDQSSTSSTELERPIDSGLASDTSTNKDDLPPGCRTKPDRVDEGLLPEGYSPIPKYDVKPLTAFAYLIYNDPPTHLAILRIHAQLLSIQRQWHPSNVPQKFMDLFDVLSMTFAELKRFSGWIMSRDKIRFELHLFQSILEVGLDFAGEVLPELTIREENLVRHMIGVDWKHEKFVYREMNDPDQGHYFFAKIKVAIEKKKEQKMKEQREKKEKEKKKQLEEESMEREREKEMDRLEMEMRRKIMLEEQWEKQWAKTSWRRTLFGPRHY